MRKMSWFLPTVCLAVGLILLTPTASPGSQAEGRQAPGNGGSGEVFELHFIGNGKTSEGTPLGFRTYDGSEGNKVWVTYGVFPSVDSAKNQFQVWLKPARKVLKRGLKRNETGKVVGQRAVAVLAASGQQEELPTIVWTNGRRCYWVQSTSLASALQFEERIDQQRPVTGR